MHNILEHKLFGLSFYLVAALSLQQVVIIPVLALFLILAVYKARSALFKSHAKYMLSIFAGVSLVVLIVGNVFAPDERIIAALTAVGIGFCMLAFGAYRFTRQSAPIVVRSPG